MLRAVSVYLPAWPMDLWKRRARRSGTPAPSAEPVLLVHTVRQRPVVAACCALAARAGVVPGMSAADARALIRARSVRIEAYDAGRDGAALFSLARWATRFSPCVAPTAPDGLFINATGCLRLFGGARRLMRGMVRELGRLGVGCRVVMAPTFGAAWAVARYGGDGRSIRIVHAESLREELAPLPVRALRVGEDLVGALAEVGVERVGELMTLPRATLPSRFGPELLVRLDQATGWALEGIEPVRVREPARAERALDGPTTNLEALGVVVRGLLASLSAQLATRGAGVRRLEASFDRTDLGPITLGVALGNPSREVRHLWSLLRPRMERMQMGFGVDRVELVAARCGRVREEQVTRWDEGAARTVDRRAFDELCDTLTNRLGARRVVRAGAADTHIPERAYEYVEASDARGASGPLGALAPGRERRTRTRVAAPAGASAMPGDRPTLLFRVPEPACMIAGGDEGLLPRLRWRGDEREIVSSVGPERIGEAWWACAGGPRPALDLARDYYRVQGREGRWVWVFREVGTGRWYVHGVWA